MTTAATLTTWNRWFLVAALFGAAGCSTPRFGARPPAPPVYPGAVWPDDRGRHIQAHGGGILKLRDTYYWFGEDRTAGLDRGFRYVSCYSSTDLSTWKFRRQVVKLADPENLGRNWVLERPKVFFNRKTGKYVMYAHIDGRGSYCSVA